ncbi:MAG: arylesterase [Pseudomonadota bacterium]|nr:arylesterase [Pseudomonadota bacterium]
MAFLLALVLLLVPARAETVRLMALGDSLTAGLGVEPQEAFPVKLEAALRAKGFDVAVENAGVSGDTTKGALSRLDWAVDADVDAVIVELGANDALRGVDPVETHASLAAIVGKLRQRGIAVLIAGMKAPPNLGRSYGERFDEIFPRVAAQSGVPLYPFFLEGVAAEPQLNQADGMHPNASGVEEIVRRILPTVEKLLRSLRA